MCVTSSSVVYVVYACIACCYVAIRYSSRRVRLCVSASVYVNVFTQCAPVYVFTHTFTHSVRQCVYLLVYSVRAFV